MRVFWQAITGVTIYHLIITFLLVLTIIGGFKFGFEKIYWQVGVVLLYTILFGLFFDYLETKRWVLTPGPIITGLIIGLVGQFGEDPLKLIAVAFLAMAIKFLIKMSGRNVFNPAGSGLLAGSLLLGSYSSWWIGGAPFWVFYIWLVILLFKLKRWSPMVAFLLPSLLFGGVGILTSSTTLFFISVMLIEIKTSPYQVKNGLIYGFVVAVVSLILPQLGLPADSLIAALLFGNLTARVLGKYSN